jgi:hypothetical protein
MKGSAPHLSSASHTGLMVENGFVVEAQRRHGNSPYAPAVEWNGKFANEWIFDYTRYSMCLTYTTFSRT